MDVFQFRKAKDPLNGGLDPGIQMDRVNKMHFREISGQYGNGPANRLKSGTEIFATVAGDEHYFTVTENAQIFIREAGNGRRVLPDPFKRYEQCIDDGIPGDMDRFFRDPFPEKVLFVQLGRGKMEGGKVAGKPAVHLFGERGITIPGTEARFDMGNRDLVVKGSEGRTNDRGGVALDQDQCWFFTGKVIINGKECTGSKAGRRLSMLHQVQVGIGPDPEDAEYLVKHPAMLGRHTNMTIEMIGFLPESQDDGG